jgi:hypothetical protein
MPSPPPRRKAGLPVGAWLGIAAGVVVLIVAGAVTTAVLAGRNTPRTPSTTTPAQAPAASDVEVASCSTTDAGNATVTIRVTNSTTRTRSYIVAISYRDGDGTRIATGTVSINSVQPGESAQDDDIAFTSGTVAECVVTDVTRY